METTNKRKLRILYLKQFFEEQTDEEHPALMGDIIKYLDKYGVAAEGKNIYYDIDALEQYYGMDLRDTENNKRYYLPNREFDVSEVKLIIDSVASAKYLSEKQSTGLIEKLEKLLNVHHRRTLKNQIKTINRVKTKNPKVLYSVELILSAIETKDSIEFKYYQYNMNKEQEFKHDGKTYHVFPRNLLYDNDTYYMLAYESGELKTYRVDRMAQVKQVEATELDSHYFYRGKIDVASYAKSTFGMFHGENKTVKMVFKKDMMDTVIDRFGEDVETEIVDDEHFRVTTDIAVSPQFFGWIFGLGDNVMIETLDVAKQMKDMLKERHKAYREEHSASIYKK